MIPNAIGSPGTATPTDMLRVRRPRQSVLSADETERPRHFRIYQDRREVPWSGCRSNARLAARSCRNEELRVVFDDGTYYDELASATPVRDAEGTVIGAVGAAVEITERKVGRGTRPPRGAARPAYWAARTAPCSTTVSSTRSPGPTQ